MNWRNTLLYLAKIVGLAIIYHLAARFGLQMAYVQQNTSPVWPPSGIALAALLLAGIEYWPGITLGVVAGSLLTGAPLGMALGFGAANTLEAVIAAVLLKKWIRFDPGISRIRDVIGLVTASACGTAVSAVIGVSTLILSGSVPSSAFFSLGIVWFIGNLLGCLVITPFLLTWARLLSTKSFRHWQRSRILESAIFLVCLIFVSLYVFASPSGAGALHQALIYVIFPFAIWAALRMGTVGAASTVFIVSGIAIWGTIHELGPFAGMPINESLILLQTFTAVVALISLTLAAASAERRRAAGALRKQVDELAAERPGNSFVPDCAGIAVQRCPARQGQSSGCALEPAKRFSGVDGGTLPGQPDREAGAAQPGRPGALCPRARLAERTGRIGFAYHPPLVIPKAPYFLPGLFVVEGAYFLRGKWGGKTPKNYAFFSAQVSL